MDEGLSKCDVFFFFMSQNSLKSKMAELKWQTALNKRAKKQIKFIPVKLDDCEIPEILSQILYIDIHKFGLDVGKKQILTLL